MIVAMPVHNSNEAQLQQNRCNKETSQLDSRRRKSTYPIYDSEVDNTTIYCGYSVYWLRCESGAWPFREAIFRFIRRLSILSKSLLVG